MMQELLEELAKKRDKSLELYHKSVEDRVRQYHSGWVAGLEHTITLIQKQRRNNK